MYNDLDGDIVNVFRVLQDPASSAELTRLLYLTPYAREEFERAYEDIDNALERARRTLIRSAMGFGSAGATKSATGFRSDSAREYGTAAKIWADYPPAVSEFCQRLRGVLIENRPATEIVTGHDTPETLFYVDPPYLLSTRVMGNHARYYYHEMSEAEHQALLQALTAATGFVVLSGYDNDLYNDTLTGWQKHQTVARISAGRGTGRRVECVWLNPACQSRMAQKSLFA